MAENAAAEYEGMCPRAGRQLSDFSPPGDGDAFPLGCTCLLSSSTVKSNSFTQARSPPV